MRAAGLAVLKGAGLGIDAVVYAMSALFAAWILATTTFSTFRSWAEIAAPSYLAGAIATALVAVVATRHTLRVGVPATRPVERARLAVLGAVTTGSCLVPTTMGVLRRATVGPEYAQSEVVVIESAARVLLQGADPYSSVFTSPELTGRAPGIREHFPYLPGMVVFGLPRAALGGVWTDARVAFLAVTVAATLYAATRLGPCRGSRLWQLLVAAPTGAFALATGGDDVPLLALAALALVLLGEARTRAVLVLLVALACTKQTMWPLGIAVLLTLPRGDPRRHALTLASIPVALFTALLLTSPAAFADMIAYPLGETGNRTPANTTTMGSAVLDGIGGEESVHRLVAAVTLVCAAALASEVALRTWQRRHAALSSGLPAAVATRFGLLILVLVAFAPVGRPGYLIYPLNALVWTMLLASRAAERRVPASHDTMVETAGTAEPMSPR